MIKLILIECHDLAFALAFAFAFAYCILNITQGYELLNPSTPQKPMCPGWRPVGGKGGKRRWGKNAAFFAKCYELSVDEPSLRGPQEAFPSPSNLMNHDPLMQGRGISEPQAGLRVEVEGKPTLEAKARRQLQFSRSRGKEG